MFNENERPRQGIRDNPLVNANLLPVVLTEPDKESSLGYMDQEAIRRTKETGRVVLLSIGSMNYVQKDIFGIVDIDFDESRRTIVVRARDTILNKEYDYEPLIATL